jgi:hypothetical protein
LVVSELRADGQAEQRIDAKTLQFLKDEALAFDTGDDMATLAADEERDERMSNLDLSQVMYVYMYVCIYICIIV